MCVYRTRPDASRSSVPRWRRQTYSVCILYMWCIYIYTYTRICTYPSTLAEVYIYIIIVYLPIPSDREDGIIVREDVEVRRERKESQYRFIINNIIIIFIYYYLLLHNIAIAVVVLYLYVYYYSHNPPGWR